MTKRRCCKCASLLLALLIFTMVSEAELSMLLGLGRRSLMHADPDYRHAWNANQDVGRFGRRFFYNEHGLRPKLASGIGAFRDGVHPNERGNRLMSKVAAEQILTLPTTWLPGVSRP